MSEITETAPAAVPVALVYWGRRGGGAALTLQIAEALAADPRFDLSVSVSAQSEIPPDSFGAIRLFPIDTFSGPISLLARTLLAPLAIGRLVRRLSDAGVRTIVTIMPHVWGLLLERAARRAGIVTVLMVHDADPHPGERRPVFDWLVRREIRRSDHIVTLSDHVAERLAARGDAAPSRVARLFHPILVFRPASPLSERTGHAFRLLFFGRILPYKGVPLLLDAFAILREAGVNCTLRVVGVGKVDAPPQRRNQPGLSIEEGWVSPGAVGDVLAAADAIVLPYTEASQSGVITAAYGAGIPVVATPVGGLAEQVVDGETGVLATAATPAALAAAVRRLIEAPGLHAACRAGLGPYADRHSAARFAAALGDAILAIRDPAR